VDDTLPGVYCLRSNQTEWDEQTLWQTYVTLTDLEAVFRSLKSELGLRPVYHHKTDRVSGHLFISVLAYHLARKSHRPIEKGRLSLA
jgi:transposase